LLNKTSSRYDNPNGLVSNLVRNKLPRQQLTLEGNFSQHFLLYCNPGQQVIALQLIAPDIMAYLIDNALRMDVEIIDGQVALVSRGGAKSLAALQSSLDAAVMLDRLVKAATKVTNLDTIPV